MRIDHRPYRSFESTSKSEVARLVATVDERIKEALSDERMLVSDHMVRAKEAEEVAAWLRE